MTDWAKYAGEGFALNAVLDTAKGETPVATLALFTERGPAHETAARLNGSGLKKNGTLLRFCVQQLPVENREIAHLAEARLRNAVNMISGEGVTT